MHPLQLDVMSRSLHTDQGSSDPNCVVLCSDRTRKKAAILPYRSALLRQSSGSSSCRMSRASTPSRNPSVPIRAVPTRAPHRPRCCLLARAEVAVLPYRSGQFRPGRQRHDRLHQDRVAELVAIPPYRSGLLRRHRLRHHASQDRLVEIPPYRSGFLRRSGRCAVADTQVRVAIPPYRSGQFRRTAHALVSLYYYKSQSLPTDQGSSDRRAGEPEDAAEHRVVAIPPYRSGLLRRSVRPLRRGRIESRNPSLPIRAPPTG